MDLISYILSRKYVDNSISGISGVLAGKNCTIYSSTKSGDTTTIVFKWTSDDGTERTTEIQVEDGETPTITSTEITGGHKLTFTTQDPTQSISFNVMDGAKGDMGISVVASNVDENNNLTLTLSNGNVINAGKIKAVTTVDNALSTTSSNPVENKVITNALNNKIDKEAGKGLFSDEEKAKLNNIEDGAQVNVLEKLIINGQEATITDKSIALTLITSAVSNLQNYYLKTETYTKQEVEDLIGSTVGVTIEIVEKLPTEGQSNVIYFLPTETEGVYSQYIYSNNSWILIGSTTVDLSNYYTKAQVDTLLNGKQNVLTIDSFPTALSNNPVASGGVYTAIAQMQPQFQFANMPTASSTNLGFVYQYTGATGTYTQNMFYRCVYDDVLGEYKWVEVIFHATVTVDSAISGTSTNPVQNKVIKEALDTKQDIMQYSTMPSAQDNLGKIVQYIGTNTANYTNGYFYKAIYDSTSDVYLWTVIKFSADMLVDNALSTTSENPVQNKVITQKLEACLEKKTTMPVASEDVANKIYLYTGNTTQDYKKGVVYQCVSDGQDPATYSWVALIDFGTAVTPEQFGAIGDGVNDDTNALQSAVNSEKTIVFNPKGNYKITHRVILKSNTVYDFNEATVTCYNGAGFNVGNTENITIQNINLIGSEESGYNARIVCDPKESSADGFKLLNSNIINYYKDSRTNNHSLWAFLGNGSNMIFDNCHIDTHLGGCWGGCVHFGYGQNIRVTNCWVYGGDDAIAPLPHCGGMFGDLSSIDVGLSVYIDNCWLASWYAYCVGIGTYLGGSETTHTEWLPPSDNVKVYVTNSKLHNHVFKDGTRNTVASHYVSCVNCEFTYDPTLREDLGYPYQSYESFYLIGANSVDDIDINDAQFNFDNCTFDFSLTQIDSPLIAQLVKPISHLSFTNSTFTNNGDCFVRLVGKVTKELLFDNVTFNLTQSHEASFFRETIAEHIIIRNSNIVSRGGRLLMVDDNADNIQYIEITNNVIDLISSDKCILYNSPAIGNANIIVKNNTTNGFIPSCGFMTDNNICDTDEVIPLDVNSKPYLIHKSDYMLVKPQGESWLLKNLKCLAQPLAQSIVTMNGIKYYKVTKLEQAVIPFDFTAFGDNVIENTPCKTVIKSMDDVGVVSIFEATSSSEYITVSEDFYLYLASGQCGDSYDWATMTVYFDDGTTVDTWGAPTLIQAGKVITKVRLNLKHNTLYQSNNIIYQLSTFDMVTRTAQTIVNGLPQSIDIYNNIISYNKTNWKANNTVLMNTSLMSPSYLLLDLADPNSEIIVSPIYHEHNFEFDYYVDWNNSADNIVEFTAQELQAMW